MPKVKGLTRSLCVMDCMTPPDMDSDIPVKIVIRIVGILM